MFHRFSKKMLYATIGISIGLRYVYKYECKGITDPIIGTEKNDGKGYRYSI